MFGNHLQEKNSTTVDEPARNCSEDSVRRARGHRDIIFCINELTDVTNERERLIFR